MFIILSLIIIASFLTIMMYLSGRLEENSETIDDETVNKSTSSDTTSSLLVSQSHDTGSNHDTGSHCDTGSSFDGGGSFGGDCGGF